MAKEEYSHTEMAQVRQSDGISVIFDQSSPALSRSRSRSKSSSGSRSSRRSRVRDSHRRRYRSSSSSSCSSRSSSRTRSRSHPRCHRPSSRCRCANHRRYGRGRRSPPRHHRSRRDRSRDRSSSRLSRNRRAVSRLSKSPQRSRSRSGSSEHSVNSSLNDKTEVLNAPESNATTIQGVETLELPESVKPVLAEQPVESKQFLPDTWVRLEDPEKTPSQSSEEEPDDMFNPKMSPKRKTISFSLNNPVVKPTVAAPFSAKVTSRVDSYESRRPYGHWVPVKSGQRFNSRKHTYAKAH